METKTKAKARTKESAVSDEQIIAAIISNGTIQAAADQCKITSRAVYDRMKEDSFRKLYREAKSEIIRAAVLNINSQIATAVEVISNIVSDERNTPNTRLQAANIILNNANKLAERLAFEEGMQEKLEAVNEPVRYIFSWKDSSDKDEEEKPDFDTY